MVQLLKANKIFLIPLIILLMIYCVLLVIYPKAELHMLSNQVNIPILDFFFKYWTHIGDGLMILLLSVIFLFVKFRFALLFALGSGVTAGITQLFKLVVFKDFVRPETYFKLHETYQLRVIEGVDLHAMHSFPSGHTGTAFNVFFMLALLSGNNFMKFSCFVMAALAAYSRVHISQHFLMDITLGSALGTLVMLFFFWWFHTFKAEWLDNSIIKRK